MAKDPARENQEERKPFQPVLDWLMVSYPAAFSRPPKVALKIGVRKDLVLPAKAAGFSYLQLNRALSCYCRSPAYLKQLTSAQERVDLAGEPAGEVTEEQRAHARKQLAERARKAKAPAKKPSEAKPPAPAPATPEPKVQWAAANRPVLSLRRAPGAR